ncbi:MAG: hypothetical protein WBP72_14600, partial [Rhodocyclaceae bacterium]
RHLRSVGWAMTSPPYDPSWDAHPAPGTGKTRLPKLKENEDKRRLSDGEEEPNGLLQRIPGRRSTKKIQHFHPARFSRLSERR